MPLSVFALKAAVAVKLATLVPASADLVTGGLPANVPSTQSPRRIYVLDVRNDTPLPIYLPGVQVRKEEYMLQIALEVLNFSGRSVTGYADTEAKMGTLVAAIETLVAADPEFGGVVHASGLALASESCGVYGDQGGTGWIAHALLELHVEKHGM